MKLDIPEIDQIPEFMKILDDLSVGNNVFLIGPAGTGKTSLAEKVAYSFNNRSENDKKAPPFITLNCNQYTSPTEIRGGQTIEGYKEGALITAWKEGKILILDEMPKLDPNTAGILNDALAKNSKSGTIIFNGLNEPIEKHDNFGCIATGNTSGKEVSATYGGNNRQDASLLDRFSSSCYQIGYNEVLESSLIYPLVYEICTRIRQQILSHAYGSGNETETIMTLRTMSNMAKIYELEMLRLTQMKDSRGKIVPDHSNGKRLKDSIESYLNLMPDEVAHTFRLNLSLETFYNRYRDRDSMKSFRNEYTKRLTSV
ncbi:MAG: AAA family ATPase [Cyclobacteriaceae bacterium]